LSTQFDKMDELINTGELEIDDIGTLRIERETLARVKDGFTANIVKIEYENVNGYEDRNGLLKITSTDNFVKYKLIFDQYSYKGNIGRGYESVLDLEGNKIYTKVDYSRRVGKNYLTQKVYNSHIKPVDVIEMSGTKGEEYTVVINRTSDKERINIIKSNSSGREKVCEVSKDYLAEMSEKYRGDKIFDTDKLMNEDEQYFRFFECLKEIYYTGAIKVFSQNVDKLNINFNQFYNYISETCNINDFDAFVEEKRGQEKWNRSVPIPIRVETGFKYKIGNNYNKYYSKEAIAKLRKVTDIMLLVAEYIPILYGKGEKCVRTPCFFHEEKTPSFTINREAQLCSCFGCKTGGNVIDFVRAAAKSLSFVDALDYLEQRALHIGSLDRELPKITHEEWISEKAKNEEKKYMSAIDWYTRNDENSIGDGEVDIEDEGLDYVPF